MKVHIYDTHVTTNEGRYVHFDVLVNDANIANVQHYAKAYLQSIDIDLAHIEQKRCDFCHSEVADEMVQEHIAQRGHSIIRLK